MANKNELIIDDGTLVYEIKNKAGQLLGEICFNPSDDVGVKSTLHLVVTSDFSSLATE